jgi:hypothetical protein
MARAARWFVRHFDQDGEIVGAIEVRSEQEAVAEADAKLGEIPETHYVGFARDAENAPVTLLYTDDGERLALDWGLAHADGSWTANAESITWRLGGWISE